MAVFCLFIFLLCLRNLSHNSSSGTVGNAFTSLEDLRRLDLSSHDYTTGDLILTSFQDLKNLTALNLTGPVGVNFRVKSFNVLHEVPVTVLQDVYREMHYQRQLVGWKSTGGQSWKGISCNGSSVIFIDLSFNDFSGNIWPSLASMKYLCHLPVGNVFTSLEDLRRMDLSSNKFSTGDLILTSFQDLKNLSALHKCSACYKQYKKKEDLVKHMRESYHSIHQPKCGVCQKYCKLFESLREHLTGTELIAVNCEMESYNRGPLTIMRRHLNLSNNSSSGPVGNVALIIVSNDDTNVTSAAASQEVGPWHGILLLCFMLMSQVAAAAPNEVEQQQQQQQPNDDGDQGAVVVVIEQQQEPEEQQPNDDGDQGAVVVVNEGENSWCQETDNNFRRDGRRESKEVRAQRHWRKHPRKEKK